MIINFATLLINPGEIANFNWKSSKHNSELFHPNTKFSTSFI